MGELRESKKRETRQRLSDVATRMFLERGFEAVTLEEIAAAAKVSKMTVLNYFARKEELMLDREDQLLLMPFRQALLERPKGQRVTTTLRALLDGETMLTRVEKHTLGWWQVINESPSLQARLRELADEAIDGLAEVLGGNGEARLLAGFIVTTVRIARDEAVRLLGAGASEKKANTALRALLDRGLDAAQRLEQP